MNSNSPLALADIAQRVRQARRDRKLSQAELGKRAGLSRMPVYRLEAGQDVSLRSLLAMLPPLGLALRLDAAPTGPLRASDLAQTFAHLHASEDDDPDNGNP